MLSSDYKKGKHIINTAKHNIDYNKNVALNYICLNYIKLLLKLGNSFNISDENKNKLLVLTNQLQ